MKKLFIITMLALCALLPVDSQAFEKGECVVIKDLDVYSGCVAEFYGCYYETCSSIVVLMCNGGVRSKFVYNIDTWNLRSCTNLEARELRKWWSFSKPREDFQME